MTATPRLRRAPLEVARRHKRGSRIAKRQPSSNRACPVGDHRVIAGDQPQAPAIVKPAPSPPRWAFSAATGVPDAAVHDARRASERRAHARAGADCNGDLPQRTEAVEPSIRARRGRRTRVSLLIGRKRDSTREVTLSRSRPLARVASRCQPVTRSAETPTAACKREFIRRKNLKKLTTLYSAHISRLAPLRPMRSFHLCWFS